MKEITPRKAATVKHTRYVQAEMKREVRKEAGHQCMYKTANGVRCSQTAYLEIDHVRPWAMGGSSKKKTNLRVLCRAHNQMLAKQYFPKHFQQHLSKDTAGSRF